MFKLKYLKIWMIALLVLVSMNATSCSETSPERNVSAKEEQYRTEKNQQRLNQVQPAPQVDYSIERENLINRFKLMNDQSVVFYLYVFNEGSDNPVLEFIVNKVSSVNSQLTNPEQLVYQQDYHAGDYHILPSPAEDGSYGTNGDAVFGFSPDGIYVETNMNYVCSLVPLNFEGVKKVNLSVSQQQELKTLLKRVLKK